jgi:hypothetical protein
MSIDAIYSVIRSTMEIFLISSSAVWWMVMASIGTKRGEIKIIQAMAPTDKQDIQMMVEVSSSGMLASHKGGKKNSHTATIE